MKSCSTRRWGASKRPSSRRCAMALFGYPMRSRDESAAIGTVNTTKAASSTRSISRLICTRSSGDLRARRPILDSHILRPAARAQARRSTRPAPGRRQGPRRPRPRPRPPVGRLGPPPHQGPPQSRGQHHTEHPDVPRRHQAGTQEPDHGEDVAPPGPAPEQDQQGQDHEGQGEVPAGPREVGRTPLDDVPERLLLLAQGEREEQQLRPERVQDRHRQPGQRIPTGTAGRGGEGRGCR